MLTNVATNPTGHALTSRHCFRFQVHWRSKRLVKISLEFMPSGRCGCIQTGNSKY